MVARLLSRSTLPRSKMMTRAMSYKPSTRHPNGARLLALDGGGVRGIMALEVLDALMVLIKERKGLAEIPRPVDYFELAAGTSTGGIMGIMLFRLRMTARETIEQYNKIAEQVFSPKVYGFNISRLVGNTVAGWINNSKTLVQNSRFDDASMKSAIDGVVAEFGLDEQDRKLKGNAPLHHPESGRVFCCTTVQNRAETVLLRSYRQKNVYTSSIVNNAMSEHQDEITISLAARATSAAPTFFPEVRFPESSPKLTFWDGGLLNNNPIDQLWYSRYELVQAEDPPPPISCVISLGTGYMRPGSPLDSWFKLAGVATHVMDFATNTNAKGKDFSRHMSQMNRRSEHKNSKYIRLNPYLGFRGIGLADYTRMKDLQKIARKYMEHPSNRERIESAVGAICA